jgi:hypothetical protein
VGVADRDYSKWTRTERRRFYSGRTANAAGLVTILLLAVVAALIWHAHSTTHHKIVRYKPGVCADPAQVACIKP